MVGNGVSSGVDVGVIDCVTVADGVDVIVLVGVDVLVTDGVFVGKGVSAGVFVALIDCVTVGLTVLVGVTVGVTVGVAVFVVVKVGVSVVVGVNVLVGVFVGVGVGKILYEKSLSRQGMLQLGQSGLNKLNLAFNISKLCFTSGADNGETYILN